MCFSKISERAEDIHNIHRCFFYIYTCVYENEFKNHGSQRILNVTLPKKKSSFNLDLFMVLDGIFLFFFFESMSQDGYPKYFDGNLEKCRYR